MVKHQSIPIYPYVGIMAVETIRLGFCLLVIGVATSLQIEICQNSIVKYKFWQEDRLITVDQSIDYNWLQIDYSPNRSRYFRLDAINRGKLLALNNV